MTPTNLKTTYNDEANSEPAKENGAIAFLVKPVNGDELRQLVAANLSAS